MLPTPLRLAAVAVSLLVAGLYILTFWISRESNRLMSERTVAAIATELELLRHARDTGGLDALTALVAQRSASATDAVYFLQAADGRVLVAGSAQVPKPIEPGSNLYHYVPAKPNVATERMAAGVSVPAGQGATLYVLRDIEETRLFAERLKTTALIAASVLAAAGLGAGILLSNFFNRRIANITAASTAIMAGDLAQRIPRDHSGDELDNLAANLNAMLARIDDLMQALREVSDNIAHDLKTPLTRLRNRAEAALRDPAGTTAYRAGLEHTLEEADGLIQTFNALLLIARLEAGAVEDSKSATDLSALAHDVAELYQPVAEEADLAFSVNIAPGLEAPVNRQLVGQALANMIDNAIKYSKGIGSIITLNAVRMEGAIEITVADNGPGIKAADRPRVLKRFVRLEESRSRPGTGLGLSLVAAVARLHSGGVLLEDNNPGLRISLRLVAPMGRTVSGNQQVQATEA